MGKLPAKFAVVPQSVIDKFTPYLMLALAYQLNKEYSKLILPENATELDPGAYPYAYELLCYYE